MGKSRSTSPGGRSITRTMLKHRRRHLLLSCALAALVVVGAACVPPAAPARPRADHGCVRVDPTPAVGMVHRAFAATVGTVRRVGRSRDPGPSLRDRRRRRGRGRRRRVHPGDRRDRLVPIHRFGARVEEQLRRHRRHRHQPGARVLPRRAHRRAGPDPAPAAYGDASAGSCTIPPLHNPCVDPRFNLVAPKGKAPTWNVMGNGNWASSTTYASSRSFASTTRRAPSTVFLPPEVWPPEVWPPEVWLPEVWQARRAARRARGGGQNRCREARPSRISRSPGRYRT